MQAAVQGTQKCLCQQIFLKKPSKQKSLGSMTNIIYTFSSYKTYYRVFFNGLLNTNMYFQFESDEQNNGEFEMHNFDLSLVFQKYI